MEDKELVQGSIGQAGKYEIAVKNGELVLDVSASVGPAKIAIVADLDAKSVLLAGMEWLKAKIPGQIDDTVINLLEEKLKSL